ncbi:outer membrane protein assembly factor BamB family protein [Carboxylicivirga linearis]|uniref:PQQ-binding-like beta-propeller repeat protein n=1 Tax=Carboxylicivirga linearis TaxID=1628157 RepID=A0ABS5JWE6_9BACT|nr:PQQ-binding-like beta-propeller repeat protein [Carboxylicivirga linearis]MBS2099148.1 PQQ-binding-like beta-propeller repeat protein [Carboxylicivirga linearis]
MKSKLLLVFLFSLSIHCFAQDWPQFLGPTRDSKSPQKGLLKEWPAEGPQILWTDSVGIGYGGPVVQKGKVYLLDRNDETGDIMRCFDLSNGEELWRYEYSAPGSVMFPGSRSVPAVDGNFVYSCGFYGDLYCFNTKTHKPVWNNNIWKDFGGEKIPTWAITQCPLIYGNLVIVASQAPEAGVVAYNKKTGEVEWKTPSLGLTGYASPAIVKIDGKDNVVMITASSRNGDEMGNVVGLNPKSGEQLWKYNNWKCRNPIPSAVDAGDNKILIAGGYELGATLIQIVKAEDGSYTTKELFVTEEFGNQLTAPLLIDGYFYTQYATNRRRDGMVCMNMDGEILWRTKKDPDFNKGSMIYADGHILATDGVQSLYLIKPDPSEYKPISSAQILAPEGTKVEGAALQVGGSTQNWAPIALADGKLIIRDQNRIMCVKVAE